MTVTGAKGYDTRDFVAECRNLQVTPHVAQNEGRRERTSARLFSLSTAETSQSFFLACKIGIWPKLGGCKHQSDSFADVFGNGPRLAG